MNIAVFDLVHYQNSDFREPFQWINERTGEPVDDWSGSTFEMDIKTADGTAIARLREWPVIGRPIEPFPKQEDA